MVEEEVGEEEDVLFPVLQVRHVEGELVQAVVEVLAESSLGDGLRQVFVRGAYQAHVHLDFLVGPHRADLAFLDGPQELYLHVIAQIAYLVEEEGAAIGFHESPGLVAHGPGERAFHVAEEL